MTQILDGKALAARIQENLRVRIREHRDSGRRSPGLAVVRVGDDPASAVYVRNKHKACATAGIAAPEIRLPEATPQAELEAQILALNADPAIDGILVQLPLPPPLDAQRALDQVNPDKDVDGFHPINAGRLLLGIPALAPCTPLGIMALLDEARVPIEGRRAVVIGRSNIVGKPVALMLLSRNATVTICHSRTRDLPAIVREADLVIAAVGQAQVVRGSWIRPGAVVVDVGINRDPVGKLVGDVCFDEAYPIASAITPVPGGVGPMTVTMLLSNTLAAYERHIGWRDQPLASR